MTQVPLPLLAPAPVHPWRWESDGDGERAVGLPHGVSATLTPRHAEHGSAWRFRVACVPLLTWHGGPARDREDARAGADADLARWIGRLAARAR